MSASPSPPSKSMKATEVVKKSAEKLEVDDDYEDDDDFT